MTTRKRNPSRDRLPPEPGEVRLRKVHVAEDGRVCLDVTLPREWAGRDVELTFGEHGVTLHRPRK